MPGDGNKKEQIPLSGFTLGTSLQRSDRRIEVISGFSLNQTGKSKLFKPKSQWSNNVEFPSFFLIQIRHLPICCTRANIDGFTKSRHPPIFWIPACAGMTIRQLTSGRYNRCHTAKPVPAEAGSRYPVFKTTF